MIATQLDIFSSLSISKAQWQDIEGLVYVQNYISKDDEKKLLEIIDAQPWILDLKRRVQHYGYRYNYKSRRIDLSMKVGNLPDWLNNLAQRLYAEGYFKEMPDQVIINEYEPGQGISPHIDCEPCFEDTVVSLSLASGTTMDFIHTTNNEKIPVYLMPRSIVILQGESRYKWQHSIPARKSDTNENKIIKRDRRVSLTFRKVIL
jgi:alkylated DNA repair dioxygenase AlkB